MKKEKPPSKERIDLLLVQRKIAESRQKAQALILAGKVIVNGKEAKKAGDLAFVDSEINLKENPFPFVSRGGIKLQKALEEFQIDVKGLKCLDIGASTGGFTDCLLQRGAKSVIALDVGRNQIHEKLKNDNRVHIIENYNARFLKKEDLPFEIDLVVIDVSFISLRLILKAVKDALPDSKVIALVKPQFEAGREKIGKGGVVKDENVKMNVLESVKNFASSIGYKVFGETKSPIKGSKGNEEFLIYFIINGKEDYEKQTF
ncbi:MAG: TlyA family RNA methyltransferase [Acidobacteriota bacterium]